MDPNVTLAAVAQALEVGDSDVLGSAIGDLTAWLHKGGFRPTNIDQYPEAWKLVWLSV